MTGLFVKKFLYLNSGEYNRWSGLIIFRKPLRRW